MAVDFKLRKKKTDSLNFANEAENEGVSWEIGGWAGGGAEPSWNSSLGNGKEDRRICQPEYKFAEEEKAASSGQTLALAW